MKKLLVCACLALLTVGLSVAQEKRPLPDRFGGNNGPLFRQLNLTDAQRKDIEELRFDMQKKAIEQQGKIKTSRLELAELFKADNLDQAAIQKKVSELSQLQSQLRSMRIDHWFSVNNLLTPDQQKVWKRISGRFLMQQRQRMIRGRMSQFRGAMRNQMRMRRAPAEPMDR